MLRRLKSGKSSSGVVLDISVEDRLIDLVGERFDAGIRRGHLLDEATIAHRISADDELVPVASPNYLSDREAPEHPSDLRAHRLIGIRRRLHGTVPPWRLTAGEQRATIAGAGALIVDDPAIARQAAVGGLGIALLARAYVATHVADKSLHCLLDGWSISAPGFHLYYPRPLKASSPLAIIRDWLVALDSSQRAMEL